MKVLSLAWGKRYRALAARLRRSAAGAGLGKPEIWEMPGEPESRERAWRARPRMLLEAMGRYKEPLLYVDVDVQFRARPARVLELADREDLDLAAVRLPGGAWRCGVLLIRPTAGAFRAIEAWDDLLERGGWTNDEPEFARAVRQVRPAIAELPPEYCWVEAWNDRANFGHQRPVIEANGV